MLSLTIYFIFALSVESIRIPSSTRFLSRLFSTTTTTTITFSTLVEGDPITNLNGNDLASHLLDSGCGSVAIVTQDPSASRSQLIHGEPIAPSKRGRTCWDQSVVRLTTFPPSSAIHSIPKILDIYNNSFIGRAATDPIIETEEVDNGKDWMGEVQRGWEPIVIARASDNRQIIVRLPFHEDSDCSEEISIRLEGGAAFGTGDHPTTRMASQELVDVTEEKGGGRVLDYGSGSGVLGLVALAVGANKVDGVEVDQMAIESAKRNARLNERESLSRMWAPPVGAPGSSISDEDTGVATESVGIVALPPPETQLLYDVVVANIIAPILIDIKDTLYSYAKMGAVIILSGVLEEQASDVIGKFTDAGWSDVWDGVVPRCGKKAREERKN